jgi:glutathione S-transferase
MSQYRLFGSNGSPYSVKIRAVLRYRRLPFVWSRLTTATADILKKVKVPVIPVLEYPDGSFANDSTPLIYDLERRHAERRIVPEDPGLAFLAHLVEDMADEWGTKMMFHYRWHDPLDQEFCSRWLARERLGGAGEEAVAKAARIFRDRQVGRMAIVGVQAANRPVIAETYRRLLLVTEKMCQQGDFLFGERPSLAEFGLYGQLWQLGFDPSPAAIMRASAPATFAWLHRLDDASGVEPGAWREPGDVGDAVRGLLALAGDVYLPFLVANDAAVAKGAETFTVRLLGDDFTQAPFKYQARCLAWLREELAALPDEAKRRIAPILKDTGCWDALTRS